MRKTLWLAPLLALAFAVGCASSSGGGGGGSCPCDVGNSGLHFTIGCGQSSCVTINGQAKGYHCESDGPHEDPSVCSSGTGGSGGGSGSGGSSGIGGSSSCSVAPPCDVSTPACGSSANACPVARGCATCTGGGVCNVLNACIEPTATSVAIIGNYSGGAITVDVDQHVPGLAIGLVSYQPMQVTLTGQYAADVVAVFHAGYQAGTTVTGIDAAKQSEATRMSATSGSPTQTLMLCDIGTSGAPGCSAPSEVEAFFTSHLGGSVSLHRCQYGPYTGPLQLSAGGTCP